MKAIDFEQKTAQKIYDSYIKRLEKTAKPLLREDREDVLMEFNSHIYEGMKRNPDENEADRLLDILEKLGEPEEVLKPLIAEKKLEQATNTFNPIHVFKALALNVGNGVFYILMTLLYLSLSLFVFLIYAKITNPTEVGLFFKEGNFMALGSINPDNLQERNIVEVLGNWFIPAMMVSGVVFYAAITLLLRLKRKAK
ncbi:MAG TPA: DUF1700 domain-containing protein [Leeuwenhoekiella sp.]|nr:DUF1700 domain-containing protein [Leeuwenhoekiella sp.]